MRSGHSLFEIMWTLVVAGLLITLVALRAGERRAQGAAAACDVQLAEIETAVETWRHEHGTWPATDLADVGNDLEYFPQGLPTCPVDGTSYTIDTSGRVVDHVH